MPWSVVSTTTAATTTVSAASAMPAISAVAAISSIAAGTSVAVAVSTVSAIVVVVVVAMVMALIVAVELELRAKPNSVVKTGTHPDAWHGVVNNVSITTAAAALIVTSPICIHVGLVAANS